MLKKYYGMMILFFSMIAFSCNHTEEPDKKPSIKQEATEVAGDTITFILGDDNAPGEVFYRNAERYYRNKSGDESKVIKGIYSLTGVVDYLIDHQDTSQLPWGQINLVSHGNPYSGLSVSVKPGGQRCNALTMKEYIENDTLPEIPDGLIDDKTTIAIRSCGIGSNTELLHLIKQFFISNKAPKIKASTYFEYFLRDDSTQQVKHFLTDYWMINYKMGYRPTDRQIIQRFKTLYPKAGINWQNALQKEHASQPGEVFCYSFEVPGKWVFQYEDRDSIPVLQTNSEKIAWVRQNSVIMNDLQVIRMEPESFNWWMRRIYVRSENDETVPALWVKGYSTVLCVLKLLPPDYEPGFPFMPNLPEPLDLNKLLLK